MNHLRPAPTTLTALAFAAALAVHAGARAQATAPEAASAAPLPANVVRASADASAEGLSPAYAGGQVARGGRAGILGTKDNLDTPFSITSYTNELIQDRQARGIGDVLQNDPTVRVARGFGNFQESYFIRGFILSSDDIAYNGLYGLLPRQYISTELIERVEVLRGASAFLNGANPGGGGIGGAINLLPKRASNEALTRVTAGISSGSQFSLSTDISRRFGPDGSTGIRVDAAVRDGGTGIDDEKVKLGVAAVGLDWRSRDLRLSADLGVQNHRLKRTRTNVTLGAGVTTVPDAPDGDSNWAQPWTYSNERDVFGTFRGEVDLAADTTAWAAFGLRRGDEANSLGNITVSNGTSGAASYSRFDNTREDSVNTAELGLRGKLRTGPVDHEWVVSSNYFELKKNNAYAWDYGNDQATNLYAPVSITLPAFSGGGFSENQLADPKIDGVTRTYSLAVGDTLSLLNDDLKVTLGLRYQSIYAANYASGVVSQPIYSQDRVSPLLGAVYKLDKQVAIYGNYVEGLTQGGSAPLTGVTNRGETLAPYVSRQKEIGVKYDGGKLGADLALFTTTRPRGDVLGGGTYAVSGEDRHRGVELTLRGEPVSGLRLLGGLTWLDAKQKSTLSATTEGKQVIGVPRFQSTLGAEWDIPGLKALAVDARIVHTGARYANETNTLKVPGFTRLDVGARYYTELQGVPVTLRARIDNLTNRDYWASVGGYPNNGYLAAGAPRTFNLSASFDF